MTQIPDFMKNTMDSLRTGFYMRVLKPGLVGIGDTWCLEARPQEDLTLTMLNEYLHRGCTDGSPDVSSTPRNSTPGGAPLLERRLLQAAEHPDRWDSALAPSPFQGEFG